MSMVAATAQTQGQGTCTQDNVQEGKGPDAAGLTARAYKNCTLTSKTGCKVGPA